jgi:hypothetical protein
VSGEREKACGFCPLISHSAVKSVKGGHGGGFAFAFASAFAVFFKSISNNKSKSPSNASQPPNGGSSPF